MEITIDKLKYEDAGELFDFENENRTFFEKMVPGRGEDYYHFDTFMIQLEELLNEQKQGLSYFYLIRKRTGEILGRINLVDVDRSQNLVHIGYRVGEKHTGQGVAHKALQILLDNLSKDGFTKILAKTTNNNVASQKVLEKNGFTKLGVSNEEFVMNGETLRFVHYMWTICVT
ncbi:N-acetyltransferase [Halobacillus andaensis]|uniref:N-acetyltransferase n=1 Tax=Halobacillus andaensis TaxID=1176239 RepID=A0A917B768_HALAA|nr:GNAT family protein [Halobacillus andaensis]MBP2005091.1 ribosomal-protein-alanine N-acetyltransferase [Halobacillus andaensis]GGF28817.1 N-acetyltransferase [Halobacillus andaensis]